MKKTKRILYINPYLDILGGGEKHSLSILDVLQKKGCDITIAWNDNKVINKITDRFSLNFNHVELSTEFNSLSSIDRSIYTKRFDILFYVTDGSYFFSLAKNNFVYCMYPEKKLYIRTIINSLKWRNTNFISISKFTKKHIDKWTKTSSFLLYPYIEDEFYNNGKRNDKKQKIILSVGRFYKHLHTKNHEKIIKAFIALQDKYTIMNDFKLYVVGGVSRDQEGYYNSIVRLASKNTNITVIKNISRNDLINLYKKSMFYWHAAGWGVDIKKSPEKVEHLGITILEAMAAGCTVFAYSAGGPKEIAGKDRGILYIDENELISETYLLNSNKKQNMYINKKALEYIKTQFSYNVFEQNVQTIFNI